MSKLVDKERLAKLAKALDERAKAAVAAEAARAEAAEKAIDAKAVANAAAITAINHAENGILAQAKSHAQGLVDGEKDLREEAEGLLSGRIETLEGIIGGQTEGAFGEVKQAVADNAKAIEKLNGEADEEGSVKKAVADAVKVEKDRAEGVEAGFETRIAANAAFIAAQPAIDAEQNRRLGVLEGLISGGEGDENALTQLQNAIDAAQAAANAAQADVDAVEQRLDAENGLVSRIAANETTIAKLDGAVDVEGSVKKQIKDAIDTVNQAAGDLEDRVELLETFKDTTYPAAEQQVRTDFASADATNLQAAKTYADEKIAALVDSAPDAMNTLNELAKAIKDHGDEYTAYVATVTQNIATAKQEAIDAAASAADAKDTALHTTISAEIDADVKTEADRAIEAEADLLAAINKEVQDRGTAVAGVQGEVDALEDVVKDMKDATKDGSLAKQIADEVDRADTEEKAIRTDFAAADAILQGNIDKKVDQSAYDTKVAAIDKAIQDNTNAITKEAEDRADAIATALEAYSTTEGMKQVIGNVVNSLALTMENDQVVLKLGGVDGIKLASVSLDLATDADIDAIIEGLDEE